MARRGVRQAAGKAAENKLRANLNETGHARENCRETAGCTVAQSRARHHFTAFHDDLCPIIFYSLQRILQTPMEYMKSTRRLNFLLRWIFEIPVKAFRPECTIKNI